MRPIVRSCVRTSVFGVSTFLPVFLMAHVVEMYVHGIRPSGDWSYHFEAVLVAYVGLLIPVLVGSIIHGLSVAVAQLLGVRGLVGWTAALSVLLPIVAVATGWAWYLIGFPISVIAATIIYSVTVSISFRRSRRQ